MNINISYKFINIYRDFLKKKEQEFIKTNNPVKNKRDFMGYSLLIGLPFGFLFPIFCSVFYQEYMVSYAWLVALLSFLGIPIFGKYFAKKMLKSSRKYLINTLTKEDNKDDLLEWLNSGASLWFPEEFNFNKQILQSDMMSIEDIEKCKKILIKYRSEEILEKIFNKNEIKDLIQKQKGISYFCMSKVFYCADNINTELKNKNNDVAEMIIGNIIVSNKRDDKIKKNVNIKKEEKVI